MMARLVGLVGLSWEVLLPNKKEGWWISRIFFRGGYNKPSYFLGTKTLKLHFENRCNIFGSQPGGVPWTKRVVLVLFIKTGTGRGVFYLFKDADVVIILVFFLGMSGGQIKHHPISSFRKSILDTLPGANSLPLKIDGWKLEYYPFLLGCFLFSGANC